MMMIPLFPFSSGQRRNRTGKSPQRVGKIRTWHVPHVQDTMKRMAIATTICLGAQVVGCASHQTFTTGQTTLSQMKTVLGDPVNTSDDANGVTWFRWEWHPIRKRIFKSSPWSEYYDCDFGPDRVLRHCYFEGNESPPEVEEVDASMVQPFLSIGAQGDTEGSLGGLAFDSSYPMFPHNWTPNVGSAATWTLAMAGDDSSGQKGKANIVPLRIGYDVVFGAPGGFSVQFGPRIGAGVLDTTGVGARCCALLGGIHGILSFKYFGLYVQGDEVINRGNLNGNGFVFGAGIALGLFGVLSERRL